MTIRPITPADIPAVVELMLRNWDGVLAIYHSPAVVRRFRSHVTPEWLRQQMERKRIFVVETDGGIVASGGLADFGTPERPRPSVSQFFVHADRHRRGIGTLLMNHLRAEALANGVTHLHVPSSLNAVPFYRRAGFVVDDAQPEAADEITWMTMTLGG